MIDLQPFCGQLTTVVKKFETAAPFVMHGRLTATNGIVVLDVPTDEPDVSGNFPKAYKFLNRCSEVSSWEEWPTKSSARLLRLGTEDASAIKAVAEIGSKEIDAEWWAKIAALGQVQFGELDDCDMILFRFPNGGRGAVMPIGFVEIANVAVEVSSDE